MSINQFFIIIPQTNQIPWVYFYWLFYYINTKLNIFFWIFDLSTFELTLTALSTDAFPPELRASSLTTSRQRPLLPWTCSSSTWRAKYANHGACGHPAPWGTRLTTGLPDTQLNSDDRRELACDVEISVCKNHHRYSYWTCPLHPVTLGLLWNSWRHSSQDWEWRRSLNHDFGRKLGLHRDCSPTSLLLIFIKGSGRLCLS